MSIGAVRPEPHTAPMISRGSDCDRYDPSLDEYFLASRSLSTNSVASLLLSSSFGVNAILYSVTLGYLMGLWALSIQVAWSLSFVLLARFSSSVAGVTGVHEFLGGRFGRGTRRVAAVSSAIGLMYFVGWEITIARDALGGFTRTAGAGPIEWMVARAGLFVGLGAAVAVIYSASFGRRADARANGILNGLKSTLLIVIVAAIAASAVLSPHSQLGRDMLPPLSEAIAAVGILGFTTSLLFNFAWQFVDNSSWQSLNSGSGASSKGVAAELKRSALWVFLTVNFLGTLAGTLLRGTSGVESGNILVSVGHAVPALGSALVIALCVLILASMVSLVDVIVLAIAQALVVDVGIGDRLRTVRMKHARLAVLFVGIISSWGVQAWVHRLGGSIFDFVYIVIIAQLSLIGPVLFALLGRAGKGPMWAPILVSGITGVACAVVGTTAHVTELVDGAGAVTVLVSLLTAALVRVAVESESRHFTPRELTERRS